MVTRLALCVALAALSGGCRTAPASDPSEADAIGGLSKAEETAAIAAAMRRAASAGVEYQISPADLISVFVYGVQDMNRKARVDGKGVISLPLVGAVKLGGKTLGAARELIEKKLAAYVVAPQVSLFIEEYGNKLFFVMGEVQKPGSYSMPAESRVTVLEAISTAGGFTPVAAQDRARVLRFVDGQSKSFTIDVRTITRAGHKDKDMTLEPNDVVFIPQSLF
jgi:polysaccharide export outer membrane protein